MKHIFSLLKNLIIIHSILLTHSPAMDFIINDTQNIKKTSILRYIDEKEPYSKYCEEYKYISATERLKLLKHKDFFFGDFLLNTLKIETVNPDFIVEKNITKCSELDFNIEENLLELTEEVSHMNNNYIVLYNLTYTYGAGAAHGNGNIDYYVYDREYGFLQDWDMLFGKNEDFEDYIMDRARKELADEHFLSYFKAEKNLLNFRKKSYFGLNKNGITIQYKKYEIASGADGLPSLEIPKEVLKKYIDKNKYNKLFPFSTQ